MNADAGRSSLSSSLPRPSLPRPRSRHSVTVQGCIALPVVIAGVLCVLDESRFSGLRNWALPTHTLFATLLCGWVLAEWYTLAHKSDAAVGDARDFTRDLTLRMYLMLYAIVGVGLLIGLFSLHYGGTFHHPDGSFLIIALMGLALARAPRFLKAFLISKRGG